MAQLRKRVLDLERELSESQRIHMKATTRLQHRNAELLDLLESAKTPAVDFPGGVKAYIQSLQDTIELLEAKVARLQREARQSHEIHLKATLQLKERIAELEQALEDQAPAPENNDVEAFFHTREQDLEKNYALVEQAKEALEGGQLDRARDLYARSLVICKKWQLADGERWARQMMQEIEDRRRSR